MVADPCVPASVDRADDVLEDTSLCGGARSTLQIQTLAPPTPISRTTRRRVKPLLTGGQMMTRAAPRRRLRQCGDGSIRNRRDGCREPDAARGSSAVAAKTMPIAPRHPVDSTPASDPGRSGRRYIVGARCSISRPQFARASVSSPCCPARGHPGSCALARCDHSLWLVVVASSGTQPSSDLAIYTGIRSFDPLQP